MNIDKMSYQTKIDLLMALNEAIEETDCFGTGDLKLRAMLEVQLDVDYSQKHPDTGEPKNKYNSLECPICGATMWYTLVGKTNSWDCEECPAKLLEYHLPENLRELLRETTKGVSG